MKHRSEEYDSIISSDMGIGVFVELPNLIEGLVRVQDLKDDHYTLDEARYALIGNKNKRGYRLGDKVRVRVINANKEAKTIDFEIVEKKNEE